MGLLLDICDLRTHLHLLLGGKVVYQRGPSDNPDNRRQLFRPEKHTNTVYTVLHDEHGHLGPETTSIDLEVEGHLPKVVYSANDSTNQNCTQKSCFPVSAS